jgi:hypothetical protein
MSLDDRLNKMLGDSPGVDLTQPPLDPIAEHAIAPDAEQEEPIRVAQVGPAARRGAKAVREMLAPLFEKGAKSAPMDEVKVVPPKPDAPVVLPEPAPVAPVAPAPAAVAPSEAAPKPTPELPRPATLDEVKRVQDARDALIAEGVERVKPPDSPFNTNVYDNDSLAATVQAIAESKGLDYESMSLRQIYQQAVESGVSETFVRGLLQGDLETRVGGNELAKSLAKTLTVYDESAKRIDALLTLAKDGALNDAGKLDLRRHLSFHEVLGRQVKGMQVDVARSMNVFKRVQDAGPGLKTAEIRAVLDNLGGDDQLLKLAEAYTSMPDRASKNRLLERGFMGKLGEAFMYTYQANMLTWLETHAVNIAGSAIMGGLQPPLRLLASGIGQTRTMLLGAKQDLYTFDDVYASVFGFQNMVSDAFRMTRRAWEMNDVHKLKGDEGSKESPLTADFWSDVPVRIFRDEIMRTPDLKDTIPGLFLDGLASLQSSISFRPLASEDAFFSGMASRSQLHAEAWTYANKEFDRLISQGIPENEAMREVQLQVKQLLVERPADMQASIDAFRKMITFQTDIQDYKARGIPTGAAYAAFNDLLNNPAIKVIQPFVNTLQNIWIEGTSFVPVANLVSPRFYDDWMKGGRHRDMAVARLAMGSMAVSAAASSAIEGRMTGYGPTQREDREALQRLGWQQYSGVFNEDEILPENRRILSEITNVTSGEGKVYVSFGRFEPISYILAMGADMADAARFHTGGRWDEDSESVVKTGALVASNYITNLPIASGIGGFMDIFRSRQEDGGARLVQFMDELAKVYTNFAISGAPGVGLANSALVSNIERLIDPERSNIKPDVMDLPVGVRSFYENMNRLRSRIPIVSRDVPVALDSLGREKVALTPREHWLNYLPAVRATVGKRSEIDEMLVSLNYGISEPSDTWDGVRLSATQINRFKKLYGQEVKIDGLNLEQYLPRMLEQAFEDTEMLGEPLYVGDKQKLINQAVAKYREYARLRMIGDNKGMPINGDDLGLDGELVEFPDLRALVNRNRATKREYGN